MKHARYEIFHTNLANEYIVHAMAPCIAKSPEGMLIYELIQMCGASGNWCFFCHTYKMFIPVYNISVFSGHMYKTLIPM